MTPHDLLDGIGEVDDRLIRLAEAEPEPSKENNIVTYVKWGCIAAGILIAIGVLIWATKSGFLSMDPMNTDPSSLIASEPDTEEMIDPEESSSESINESINESTEENSGTRGMDETSETEETNKKPREITRVVPIEQKPKLMQVRYAEDQVEYSPSVPAYKLNADLSNLANKDWFSFSDAGLEKLVANGFVVDAIDDEIDEFYEVYEKNRYGIVPNFVTTDSIMHTYHLYYLKLQKNTEKQYLFNTLCGLTDEMLERSIGQYEVLKGSEWEEAAKRDVTYFGVAARLLDSKITVPAEAEGLITEEVGKIMAAEQIDTCLIIPENAERIENMDSNLPAGEDYTQYKPRSYYAEDEQLEKYFRAMMWYGRITFSQAYETQNRCALLIQLAMSDEKCYNDWYSIYEVTSFLTGGSDDLNYGDYMPVIKEIYGTDFTVDTIIGNDAAWTKYVEAIKQLRDPEINSTVFANDPAEPNVRWKDEAKGYRFMGQRFSMDGTVIQNLVYDEVKKSSDDKRRSLPDALDIPAAYGSDVALNLLVKKGDDKYPNFMEKMEEMRAKVASSNSYWSSSVTAGWQFTLMPLLEKKGDGYPSFMTNIEWQKRSLEGFIGSWIELKHDTILYAKQPYAIAECGGGDEELPDDRGYVEPEPEVYARLSTLSKATKEGLQKLGYIRPEDVESLDRLIETCNTLRDISIRELKNESLSDYDYEFIRSYGGTLEHFWEEAMKGAGSYYEQNLSEFDQELAERGADVKMDPHVQIVTDVATDPSEGLCLEGALGGISHIYVVVPIDGELHLAVGGVYNHYQFTQPIKERLTDREWRVMMGYELDEYGERHYDKREELTKPVWTDSYTASGMDIRYYEK